MTKSNTTPNCPMCGNNRHVVASGQRLWYCAMHRMGFDANDDGVVGYARPDVHAERKESREGKSHARRRTW